MKKLFLGGIFMLIIACSNEQETQTTSLIQGRPTNVSLDLPFYASVYDPNNLITETDTISFVKAGTTYTSEIIVTTDDSNGELVNISISDNFLLLNDISQGEVELAIINEASDDDRLGPHAACMQYCDENFLDGDKKLKGYGRCRARCWIDTAIRILEALPL